MEGQNSLIQHFSGQDLKDSINLEKGLQAQGGDESILVQKLLEFETHTLMPIL